MSERLKPLVVFIRRTFRRGSRAVVHHGAQGLGALKGRAVVLAVLGTSAWAAYALVKSPPLESAYEGEALLRLNQLSGDVTEVRDGALLVIPGVHRVRRIPLRDQVHHVASGAATFQTTEGLAIGVDVTVRYAMDPAKLVHAAKTLPVDIGAQVVEPAAQMVIHKTLAQYTVREAFASKRTEIQKVVETELRAVLAADGIRLQTVMMGNVELPEQYKQGLERMLAEELASEAMRYTLELKDKQVKESELVAQADKVRREKAAEAAGEEQIIAAKAQAEAMKHVLPFKQKQIEQRQLEAEAEKIARVKSAEANAQARQIEAAGEAESRRKLADAESYRQERLGKIASEQLARDGALIQKNPLLIQKTLADKLSDKISVIIAPPPSNGDFIGAALLGGAKQGAQTASNAVSTPVAASAEEE